MLARAAEPGNYDAATLKADFLELALDFVAQGLFDHSDTLETLACSVEETGGVGGPQEPSKRSSTISVPVPRRCFPEVVGVELDDSSPWGGFWNAARSEGLVGFGADLIAASGLGFNVIETFRQQCSLSLCRAAGSPRRRTHD